MYSETSLDRPPMQIQTLNDPFREVVQFRELKCCYSDIAWAIVWQSNKAIDIGEWSICGGGRFERFHCILIHGSLIGHIVHKLGNLPHRISAYRYK